MSSFQFVVNNDLPKRATAAMRSHAVKSGLQRKATTEEHSSRDSQLTIRQKSTLKSRFRLQSKPVSHEKHRKTPKVNAASNEEPDSNDLDSVIHRLDDRVHQKAPNEIQTIVLAPSQARGDPFNVYSVAQEEGVDRLIRFCSYQHLIVSLQKLVADKEPVVSRFDLNISISQIQKHWWGFAVYDPVVLHATLSLAALTWAMLVPDQEEASAAGLKQKALALQGVQKRINQNDTSDAVVGAIAALASVEAADSNYQAGSVHINGIQLLCKARGGYSVFESNIHVARAMNWADIQVAVGLGSRPSLPLLQPLESICLPPKVLALAAEPSLSHLKMFESSQDDSSIRYTFSVLRQALYGLKLSTLSVHDLRVLINGADYQIAHVLASNHLTPQGRALLLGAQVFMHHVVRETHLECNLPVLLVQRLLNHLEPIQDQLISTPDFWHGLIWCLSIGAATTPVPGNNWDFYSTLLLSVAEKANIREALDYEMILNRFIWDESLSRRLLVERRLLSFNSSGGTTDS